jgi:hypothetical protein
MTGLAWAPILTLVTVKVALVLPAATVTDDGTVAAVVILLLSATEAPPVGATPVSVTVAVEFAEPPWTLVGFNVSEATVSGFTVKVAVCATLL